MKLMQMLALGLTVAALYAVAYGLDAISGAYTWCQTNYLSYYNITSINITGRGFSGITQLNTSRLIADCVTPGFNAGMLQYFEPVKLLLYVVIAAVILYMAISLLYSRRKKDDSSKPGTPKAPQSPTGGTEAAAAETQKAG